MPSANLKSNDLGSATVQIVRRAKSRRNFTFDRISFFAVFLGLPLAGYLTFVVSPFIQAVYYSLTSWSGFTAVMAFVGLDNFQKLLTDSIFLKAMANSVMLALVLPLITIVIALILASLVTVGGSSRGQVRGLRHSNVYRVISFFPYVIPAIAVSILWGQVYNPGNGVLNGLLNSIGLPFENFAWLGQESTAMLATMFVIVWTLVGFYMILFIASIKGISAEIYEAARLDGVSRTRTMIQITIPLIRNSIRSSYIYMGIFALDAFVFMQSLNPVGGPGNSTLVISQRLFKTAFNDGKFGYACAMGVVLAAITLAFAALVYLVNRITGGKEEDVE